MYVYALYCCFPFTPRFKKQVKGMGFANEEPLRQLSLDLEKSYANTFTYGMVSLAHQELSYPKLNTWDDVYRVAFRMGTCFLMMIWLSWDCTFTSQDPGVSLFQRPIISLYAACGGFIMLVWFWGINIVMWETAKIDYVSLMGFRAENTYSATEIFSEVSLASTVFMINLLLYYKMLLREAGKYQ